MSNTDTVRTTYDALARGDVPAVLGFLDPNIDWTEADGFPCAGTYHGPDAVLQNVIMKLGTEWDGFSAVPDDFVAEGDKVIALGQYSGKYKATGKSFRTHFATCGPCATARPSSSSSTQTPPRSRKRSSPKNPFALRPACRQGRNRRAAFYVSAG